MSLLGSQVFANPTTPLWGGGGGGGGSNPTFTSVSFTLAPGETPPAASSQLAARGEALVGSTIAALDADGYLGPLQATALYTASDAPRTIYQNNGIDFQSSNGTSYFLASVNSTSNGWDLPNISTINGSAYPPSGSGSNFQLLNITQTGGNAGELNFFKDASGSSFTTFQMYPNPAAVVGSQVLLVSDASGLSDTLQVGDLQAAGTGSLPGSEPPALSLGLAGTGTLGLRLVNTDVGGVISTYATFASNAFALSNVTTINGSAYPPATYPTNRFTLSNNAGATVLAAGTPVVGIYYEPTANGRVYASANCSFTNPGSNVSPSAGLTVAANLAVSDIVSVPAVASGLNTSASVQWEFGVQAGVAYDFVATATAGVDGDFRANAATLFISFIPS